MNRSIQYIQSVGDLVLWLFAHAVAIFGFVLIVERMVHDIFSVDLGISGVGLTKISNYLALMAFLLVSMSVYLEEIHRTPPSHITLTFTAPVMILIGLALLGAHIKEGSLDSQYVDGCSLLALGGALMRIRGVAIGSLFPKLASHQTKRHN